MHLAAPGRHRPRRRTVLVLLAGMLAFSGCSDVLGGGESVVLEEVIVENDEGHGFAIAGTGGTAHFHMALQKGEVQHVTFKFGNRNGVPITDVAPYSVRIYSIANPAVLAWRSESARSGFFTGVENGYTTFRLEVSRRDSVVYTSARIGATIYTRPPQP